ncbi:MAG TPA: pyruvate dehydrogenase (acetyl-transferring) E1 component subunit alpha [Polyangia bacterium]|nr:pyruvate dehydrogenase (acetyl-transferring) E1 component subunit alpha [Polyangia bacterium]
MSRIEREVIEPREKTRTADKTQLVHYYHQMLAIRRMEEALAKAYALRKFGGFLHLYIGQEAVAVGAIATLRPEDYVIATYREHAHAYAKGMPAKEIIAEMYGKETGCSKGLGGSMHLFDASRNFLGGYGIVGGHIPIATGTAYASKYRGDGRVTLCFFGDGSVAQGAFHEGIALAALWRLPVVFICENNLYSMGTPLYRSLSVTDVSQKALGYGIARDRFDGEDVIRVRDRIAEAVRRARNESMPTLIEIRTYRFRGHSMSDAGLYRTKEEVEEWKKRDPIGFGRELLSKANVPEAEIVAIEEKVKAEIEEAVQFAEDSPELPFERLSEFTYKE